MPDFDFLFLTSDFEHLEFFFVWFGIIVGEENHGTWGEVNKCKSHVMFCRVLKWMDP